MYFKSFLQIFKTRIPSLALYLGIFLGIAVLNMQIGNNDEEKGYVNENIYLAVIDRDNSGLSDGLEKYLSDNMDVVDIIETEQGMEDALFERVAEYIVIIPEGYEKDLLEGKDVKLESKKVPDAYSAVFAENLINQYISTFKTYNKQYGSNEEIESIVKRTNESMSNSVNVVLNKENKNSDDDNLMQTCFDFGSYVILACIIWGVAEILSIFFEKSISDRVMVSPVSNFKKNLVLICYSLFYMLIVMAINIIMYIGMFRSDILDKVNLIRFVNMLCLSMVAAAVGFVVSVLVRSKGGRGAVVNTIALGCSFISGAFVPAEFLSDSVVKISTFLPVYWYIRANKCITKMLNSGIKDNLSELFKCMGIQMLFFLALISIGMVVKKRCTRQVAQ